MLNSLLTENGDSEPPPPVTRPNDLANRPLQPLE